MQTVSFGSKQDFLIFGFVTGCVWVFFHIIAFGLYADLKQCNVLGLYLMVHFYKYFFSPEFNIRDFV